MILFEHNKNMKVLQKIVEKVFLNWQHPFYSQKLFIFCSRYLDMWYGDNNFDRETNGEFSLLRKLMPRVQTVFDVGANVGDYSSEILKINNAINIHAFEPDPDSYKKLEGIPLIANNIGLGEKEEIKTLHRASRSTHNSFYTVESNTVPFPVQVSTLDLYCKKEEVDHIDFLKIDVEGHEFFVLKGAQESFKKQAIDYVQFEFSGGTVVSRTFLKDFLDFFEEYGYDVYRIRAKDIKKVEYAQDKERFTLTNYLAVRRGAYIPN